jgi:uncharacterized protein (DUF433 family)
MEMSTQLFPGWISPPDLSNVPTQPQRPGVPRFIERPNRTRKPYVKPEGVGRPRIHPVKPQPYKGKGYAWNRMEEVTVERILELQAQGLTGDQIGERFNCTRHTVYGRLRKWRREHPEVAAQHNASRTCECGRSKWASRLVCNFCAAEARKGTAVAPWDEPGPQHSTEWCKLLGDRDAIVEEAFGKERKGERNADH